MISIFNTLTGASTSTVFIRNCQDCTIYSCCKQLRIRECVNCINYVYSMAEVHIEESSGLQFACFNGGYPEHEAHLRESNLYPPEQNFWHSVYDHNPTEKGKPANWSLLPTAACTEWYPVGRCTPVVPQTSADTATGVSNQHQVGQAFGIEQMQADDQHYKSQSYSSSSVMNQESSTKVTTSSSHTEFSLEEMMQVDEKKQKKHVTLNAPGTTTPQDTPPSASRSKQNHPPAVTPLPKRHMSDDEEVKINLLGIEIALLVASARAKGIDVSVWLSESPGNKVVPVSDFNSRFISLGLAVGIQEDFETKREIDSATAAPSLASIATICSGGYDAIGVPLLDVHAFLLLAQAKVERFLMQSQGDVVMEEEYEEEEEEEQEVVPDPPQKEEKEQQEEIPVDKTPEVEVVSVEPEEEPEKEEEPLKPTLTTTSPEESMPQKKRLSISLRSTSAPPRQRRSVSSAALGDSRQSVHLQSSARQSLAGTTLEELLMATLKQPDLYHVIQVS